MEISIVTGDNCPWSLTGLPGWLAPLSGKTSGTGRAVVEFNAAVNSGGLRTAVFTVGGVAVPVRQFQADATGKLGNPTMRPVPHIAFGGEWTSTLLSINAGTLAGALSITFYDDDGSPLALPFAGGLGRSAR